MPPKSNPIKRQHVPLPTIDRIVVSVRPYRSAKTPAARHPSAPTPMAAKAATPAVVRTSAGPLRRELSNKNSGNHAHIVYNSHICPR